MGCSTSKYQHAQDERSVAPLSHSLSLPSSSAKAEGERSSKTSWKSGNRAMETVEGQYAPPQQVRFSSRLKPVKEEDHISTDFFDGKTSNSRHAYMDGPTHSIKAWKKCSPSHRFASFSHFQEVKSEAMVSPSAKGAGNGVGGHEERQKVESRASSFRVSESIDGFTGLRLLLSPAATPSRNFASSATSGTFSKSLSSSCQFPSNQSTECPRSLNTQATHIAKVLPSQLEGMGDSEENGSPLFDPSILATFEKAVETLSDDNLQGSDATSSSCSRVGCPLFDTCSDAESLDCHKEYVVNQGVQPSSTLIEDMPCKAGGDDFCYGINTVLRKKPSSKVMLIDNFGYGSNAVLQRKPSSKGTPLLNDAWVTKDYLESFDVKSPPGCEEKIVLYFTSLRAIRKTYEDCCSVRHILKGFGVHVDERDVWMHATFRQELTKVVGAVLAVPRLFVKGRYIGGVEDVKLLHEEGILEYLLEGLPAESNSKCNMCGGVRFIPCTSCNGSCKVITFREVSRCPDCNENGLMMCPLCRQY